MGFTGNMKYKNEDDFIAHANKLEIDRYAKDALDNDGFFYPKANLITSHPNLGGYTLQQLKRMSKSRGGVKTKTAKDNAQRDLVLGDWVALNDLAGTGAQITDMYSYGFENVELILHLNDGTYAYEMSMQVTRLPMDSQGHVIQNKETANALRKRPPEETIIYQNESWIIIKDYDGTSFEVSSGVEPM